MSATTVIISVDAWGYAVQGCDAREDATMIKSREQNF